MSPQQQTGDPATPRLDSGPISPLVFIDADNTLWDTDGVFARAQLALLKAVEQASAASGPAEKRLEYVRSFDQLLAEQHHLGLRYPPRLLIQALALAIKGLPQEEAVRWAWNDGSRSGLSPESVSLIERAFFNMTAQQPDLLEGVVDGLLDLSSIEAMTVVITEGSRTRVVRTIEYHGLNKYIDRVFEAPKNIRMFERIKRLATKHQSIYMIGDQLSRDIRPASEAGFKTIYVPSAFQPRWERHAGNVATFQVSTFYAATAVLIRAEMDSNSSQQANG